MIDMMSRKEDEGRWVYIPKQKLCTGQICTDVRASESFSGLGRSTALPILTVAAHRGGWKKNLFVTVQFVTIAFRCSKT